jgi:hypothetical protein
MVTGQVVDAMGAIVQGAQVHVQPTDLTTATDAHGEFSFTNLVPASYKLRIS